MRSERDDAGDGLDPGLRGRDRVLAQIEAWRKELVNLARSNRLLNFKDTRSSTLGIVAAPDELDGIEGTFSLESSGSSLRRLTQTVKESRSHQC